MDALIFDYDGVVVDSEPAHMEGFARVVKPLGIEFTKQEYCDCYLGSDDYVGFAAILRNHGHPVDQNLINKMVAEKTSFLQEALTGEITPIPGVVNFIRAIAELGVPMGICSGALRDEIKISLEHLGLGEFFPVTIAAEDVCEGKPHPEGYLTAAKKLGELAGREVCPARCVVFEDSPTGISAAKAAGMKVLALSTTYGPGELTQADEIAPDFTKIDITQLDEIL
ncbi:MAG: HAD family phosphatase [Phycisphaerae bacterium]|nr:HAD family phosphatase [Phycisphaerae bacterium]